MDLNFIPYGRQDINDDDVAAVVRVLKSDYLTQGPAVESFESAFSKYIGCKHSVAVSNGTAGLHLAYLAAGVGPGDAVIVPAITFAATANAVLYCGGTPVFCDVDPDTACMSVESLKEAVALAKTKGLQVKVITPVQFAGRPCDMKAIYDVATRVGAVIIEDACHAVGAEWREQASDPWLKVGALPKTSMTVFSFHPVKHLTTGEGGMITTQSEELALKLKKLRSHGIERDPKKFINHDLSISPVSGLPNPWYHEMQDLGLNYRMCDIQAALGASQVQRLDQFIKRRREVAEFYYRELSDLPGVLLPPKDTDTSRNSLHLFPVRSEKIRADRASVMMKLREQSVGSQVHYLPVPWHPYYVSNVDRWKSCLLKNAQEFYPSCLSIPMFASLAEHDQDGVVQSLRKLI